MKKLYEWFDGRLGYWMVLPAIIFIVLFSILPILASTQYAFFDYQLNDQTKAGLYFKPQYNSDVVDEALEYLVYYADSELDSPISEKSKAAVEAYKAEVINAQNSLKAIKDEGQTGVFEISAEAETDFLSVKAAVQAKLEALYSEHPDLIYGEDAKAVSTGLDEALIQKNFIGLKNFEMVLKDKRVVQTLGVTLIFTVFSVALELLLGLLLALIMNKAMTGKGFIRTVSLIPWAIPTSVAALIWAYMYDGSSGIMAILLEKAHVLGQSTDLLMSGSKALTAVVFADVWKTTPYMALLLLAGLQTISDSLYEAAEVDGASKLKQFFAITLPLLKPSILVALLFRTLDAFRVFDLIYVLTGGGPGGSTESISIYAYKTMFAQTKFGYGAAIVIVMALTVGLISFAYMKLLNVKLTQD